MMIWITFLIRLKAVQLSYFELITIHVRHKKYANVENQLSEENLFWDKKKSLQSSKTPK